MKKTISLLLFLILILSGTHLEAQAEETIPELPETLTAMDENGNVYEIEPEIGIVENAGAFRRASTIQVVNFNTKGFSAVTEYTEVETGISGYTCGAYGADAAYLGMNGEKVRFMMSGVIGEVAASEVQLLDKNSVSSLSHYIVVDGKLIHKVTTNMNSSLYASVLNQGPAPSYLSSGEKYYSYDGHFFYTEDDFDVMLSDLANGTRKNAVNPNEPFYNYFQFLPLRSKTSYSSSELDAMIKSKTSDSSKMRSMGATFVEKQNIYGVNALLMTGIAANESSWGTSNIATNKNNLFGLNAVDSSPGQSANYYTDVAICVKDFAETYMSKQYLNPNNWKHFGGFLGNKASGINLKYASDPYWGEKAASVAWILDSANGNKDVNKYSIGIKDIINTSHTTLNIRKEATTSSTRLYRTGGQSSQAFIILDEKDGFYKIQSDPVLNAGRTSIDGSTGEYSFSNMYAYASTSYITKVIEGTGSSDNWEVLGIHTNVASSQPLGTEITLSANIAGNADGLQYKFVWQKDNWAKWGVLQAFSTANFAKWIPEETGTYKLYVDVKDAKGLQVTKNITYEIIEGEWEISNISTDIPSPQNIGKTIQISAEVAGGSNFEYKFVWQKDNWASWGVLQNFSESNIASWNPTETGTYKLYVDVKDSKGKQKTKIIEYEIKEKDWKLNNITFSKASPQEIGTAIKVTPVVSGNADNLEYKFVWMKNNWAQWDVLQTYSTEKSATWIPKEPGTYRIYIDAREKRGTLVESKWKEFVVLPGTWEIAGISFDLESPQIKNTEIEIASRIVGNKTGLEYKFVWQKDNWASWGVIQDRSSLSKATWSFDEEGKYKIYMDVFDQSGNSETYIQEYEITDWIITVKPLSASNKGEEVTISVEEGQNTDHLEYKFVWMKENWKEWGVIQDFSEGKFVKWTPEDAGTYYFYVDVKNTITGQIESKRIAYNVK